MKTSGTEMAEATILPAQFFASPPGVKLIPERRLMGAILSDAVLVFLDDSPAEGESRRVRADVEAWLASEEASPFSFRHVCDALGLDHLAARAALAKRRPARHEGARRPDPARRAARRSR
jgi:hypothetical protein